MTGLIQALGSRAMQVVRRCYQEHPQIVHTIAGGLLGASLPSAAPIVRIACIVLGSLAGASVRRMESHTITIEDVDLTAARAGRFLVAPELTDEEASVQLISLVSRPDAPNEAQLLELCGVLNINPIAVRNLWDTELYGRALPAEERRSLLEEIFRSQIPGSWVVEIDRY